MRVHPMPIPRRPLRPALAALLCALWLGGCGYAMESPRLPNDRHSIGVAPIRNLTYEAELDVRLQEALRRRLYRDPAIRAAEPERSELVLDIELNQLSLVRVLDLNSTNVRLLTLGLGGIMTLRDTGTGALIFDRLPVLVSSRYELPESALETPALRDDALATVLSEFADQVVKQLLLTF